MGGIAVDGSGREAGLRETCREVTDDLSRLTVAVVILTVSVTVGIGGSRGQASKDRIGKEYEGAPTSDK